MRRPGLRPVARRILPQAARRALGDIRAEAQRLHRDTATFRATARNLGLAMLTGPIRRGSSKPRVCAVFAGRNDDFVPDNEARVRAVIEWNSRVLCDEVIFVEWNPLPDRPLFAPQLAKDYPNLKAYVVPPEIHQELATSSRIPVLEYLAKNVALRRATSDFICATNSDILWDMNVRRMGWFLDPRFVFTTRRIELQWNGQPPTQRFLRDPRNRLEFRFGWRQELGYGSGDFTMAHRSLWHAAKGYDESLAGSRLHCDTRGLLQLLKLGGRPVHMGLHYHLYHSTTSTGKGSTSHGDEFDYRNGLPYANPQSWGLGDCIDTEIGERVWMLRRP